MYQSLLASRVLKSGAEVNCNLFFSTRINLRLKGSKVQRKLIAEASSNWLPFITLVVAVVDDGQRSGEWC